MPPKALNGLKETSTRLLSLFVLFLSTLNAFRPFQVFRIYLNVVDAKVLDAIKAPAELKNIRGPWK